MSWANYAARRVLSSILILIGASIVIFSILRLIPGDPAQIMLGTLAPPGSLEELRRELGLHLPIWQQYLRWIGNIVTGNLGISFLSGEPVVTLLKQRFPASLELAIAGMVIGVALMLPLGILAAVNHNSKIDYSIIFFSQAGHSVPSFWLGIVLILIFGRFLNVLPPSGYVPIWVDPVENLKHILMPALTLGTINAAVLTRYLRSELLDELGNDYITTARAFGHPPRRIIFKYVLKNGMISTITVMGIQFGFMIGGLVIIETVFAYPGMGLLVIDSLLNRNYPVIQISLLVLAATFILINLAVDLVYGWLDPRIKY
ncbi:ABC-type transport system permease protein (plasmid) [Haloferax gibbonsii]|uniref:ABC-type transport system permease protein n=1 Tax=Haloferax gibbonsii TaxID=35746 RepID=A0A871BLT9_HALGI|nr:ABC transporter permease [Haloferax gibbonsii]QOS14097.1 ABC-type transport system permease protein [Haloferax gibbonsii]